MKYAFEVFKAKVDGREYWAIQSKELKGCVAQGDTQEEALALFAEIEQEWLDTAAEAGIPIPRADAEPLPEYSGKFTVRVSVRTHEEAAKQAKKEGISLNQYVNDAIVSYNAKCNVVYREKRESQITYISSFEQPYSIGNMLQRRQKDPTFAYNH